MTLKIRNVSKAFPNVQALSNVSLDILPGLGAARGGVAQLSVPVLALAGGMAFLGEPLTLRFALASVLVIGGVAAAVRPPRQP